MNTQPLQPGSTDQSLQSSSAFSQHTAVVVPVSGLPKSPVLIPDALSRKGTSALRFITPKIIVLMVITWVIVIAFVSAIVATNKSAKQSQASVPQAVSMARPLDPEAEQKFEIDRINELLGEFYGQFGIYPSVDQINSEQFRRGNPSFQKIGRNTFSDPLGKSAVLATQPTKGQYFYKPTPANCDSSKVMCSGFSLGATLASGEQYIKQSAR